MSLKILPIPAVPDETARVVRTCFPRGNWVVEVRDALGALYSDEDFADLFPIRGQPAEARGGWRWSQSCNLWRDCLTGRRQRRCAAGWIGSMRSV